MRIEIEMIKKIKEEVIEDVAEKIIADTNQAIKDSLIYYQKINTVIHIVLRNRRFYNGIVIDIMDNIMIFDDKKIGKVPIPFKEIYLVENFHAPTGGSDGISTN